MEFLVPIAIIIGLILLNGIFVAAEFAIIGSPRGAIDQRAARGERAAQRVRDILHDPRRQDRYIATAQLGITFASLGLGMYGEHVLAEWIYGWLAALGSPSWLAAHGVASGVAVLVLTYFHIVVGEMVPKSLALTYAERTVLRITGWMLLVKGLLYPLVLLLNGIGNGILALLGVRRELASTHYHSPEELEFIIRESERGGLLPEETGRVLRELFEFGELAAGQVAVPRVRIVALPAGANRQVVAETVRRAPHARYPVYEHDLDHIVGFVHVKNLLRLLYEGRALQAGEVEPVAFVPESAPLERVLESMHQARSQMAVVMDEHGGTSGIITPEDLSSEVVGETVETSGRTAELFRDADSRLHAAGTTRLGDLGDALGLDLTHESVETVSGLVLHLLGRPPRLGDAVEWRGARFEVVAIAGRGVRECVVTPPPAVSKRLKAEG